MNMIPPKRAADLAGIRHKTAYRILAYWNKHQEIPAAQKREPVKANIINDGHKEFISKISGHQKLWRL